MSEHIWSIVWRLSRPQFFSPLWHRPYPGPFNFLGLPPDIRIMIYEEAFAEDFLGSCTGCTGARVDFEQKFQFTRCNKQIYNEALPLLYTVHWFKFSVLKIWRPKYLGYYELGGLLMDFKEAPQDMLALIRGMHISLAEDCVEEDTFNGSTLTVQIFDYINRACTGLQSLQIETQGLARALYPIRGAYRYAKGSPPCRRAMVKVLRALGQRLRHLEFSIEDRIPAFEEFLGEIAPLEHWDKSFILRSKSSFGFGSEAQVYKLQGATMSDLMDRASSDEADAQSEENTIDGEQSTITGNRSTLTSDVENGGDCVNGLANKN